MILILAKLARMKSLLGASDWGRDQAERLREQLNLSWKQIPCANTYKYALLRLESEQMNEQFRKWLFRKVAESRRGTEPSRLAAQPDRRAIHLERRAVPGSPSCQQGNNKHETHRRPFQRRPGPDRPAWKVDPSHWPEVTKRVEQGESLRQIARAYEVSYETIRRVLVTQQTRHLVVTGQG